MSPCVLETLRQEHRDMTKLLNLLERQIALVVQAREPDYELLLQIADYFRSFPDLYHHPKEDLILQHLTAKYPSAAEELQALEGDHEMGSRALANFSRALVDMVLNPDLRRDRFLEAAKWFLDNERRHMAWEDERFLEIAESQLTPEDWSAIDAKCQRLGNPGFEREAHLRFCRVGRELAGWWHQPAA